MIGLACMAAIASIVLLGVHVSAALAMMEGADATASSGSLSTALAVLGLLALSTCFIMYAVVRKD